MKRQQQQKAPDSTSIWCLHLHLFI